MKVVKLNKYEYIHSIELHYVIIKKTQKIMIIMIIVVYYMHTLSHLKLVF